MAVLAAVLLLGLVAGIERQARNELESELTLRLQAVGEAGVSLIGPGVVPALVGLSPAHAGFPFYQDRRMALLQLRDRTGVRRIFLADTTGRSFVDTDPRVPIGTPLPQLRSDRVEMRKVRLGHPAAAALFTDEDGQPRKTGYVPVLQGGRVLGLVGVEADATFLRAVRVLRGRILAVGAAGILLAFVLAAVVARGLTRPLQRLVGWAGELGAGDLTRAVPIAGRDEISFLGSTLEQMRLHLEARDREQRTMVAGVAHEIRNPLGGIRLYTELLMEDPTLGPGPRERLGKILRELEHLASIVEEFLLYARPEAASPQSVPLGEAIPELVEWTRPQARLRGVRVTVAGPTVPAPWPVVRFDPNHFRQILRNLIQNAVDVSPEGGEVQVQVSGAENGIAVSVTDEGPGIASEERERIFEPFYTTKPDGAGLGLPIVRRLALLNRAQVEIAGNEGGGTRFTLLLRGAAGQEAGCGGS
jgi:signal transduction histidine kinase